MPTVSTPPHIIVYHTSHYSRTKLLVTSVLVDVYKYIYIQQHIEEILCNTLLVTISTSTQNIQYTYIHMYMNRQTVIIYGDHVQYVVLGKILATHIHLNIPSVHQKLI